MKRTLIPSEWRVSVLTGEVFGGRCDYCNAILSADAVCRIWHQEHKGHMPTVSAWARIASPEEYRGLELKLPVEWFVGRGRPFLEKTLHLPGIIFKFSCTLCQIQRFPATGKEVLAFRSRHSGHMQAARLHAVVHNFGGRAVKQTIPVLGQQDPQSVSVAQAAGPSASALARAAQLRALFQTLHGTLASIKCTACRSGHRFESQADAEDELSQHQHHLNYVYMRVMVEKPEEYAGLELKMPAHPYPFSSLVAPDGLKINCVLVELSREHGGPRATPWNAAAVKSYIQAHHSRRNQAKFLTLVRGHGGQVFQCEFPVVRCHSDSFQQVSEWEELFLHPEMEQA